MVCFAAVLALSGCETDETVSGYGASGGEWVLENINGADFSASATMTFPEKGRIAGNAPCNRFSAQQTAPYPWFGLGPILSTKRACPDLQSEAQFFAALENMTLVEVLGDVLILSNDAGDEMVFARTGG